MAEVGDLTLINLYDEPGRVDTMRFTKMRERLKGVKGPVVIGEDANAKNEAWGVI